MASAASGQRRPAVNLDAFKHWNPDAQRLALDLIRKREQNPWRPFYCPDAGCTGEPHNSGDGWDFPHARSKQRPPTDADFLVWLLLAGRGGGKTRVGSEATHRMAKRVPRMALVARTGPDLRETMVEGESGILATSPPDFMPEWEPSRKKLTWPNGAIALGYSAEEPDRLRGPQEYWAWLDEPAHYERITDVWDNLLFGLRLGRHPWALLTSTPKPSKWLKALMADDLTRISRWSTYENLRNLAPSFKRTILKKYEGTRIGRQELDAEYLERVEGALWHGDMYEYLEAMPDHFDRIVVGIDPAGTANKKSDDTGLFVVGLIGDVILPLEDATGKYSPGGWATRAVELYDKWSADALVPEDNYGGDMVVEVLEKNGAKNIRIIRVNSRRGKALRAEPIVALYEKDPKRAQHIRGATPELEDEQTTWRPASGAASPNRLDAYVHAATELARAFWLAEVSSPSEVLGQTLRMPALSNTR